MDVIAHGPQPLGATFAELLRWRARHDPDQHAYTFLLDGGTREIRFSNAELDYQARGIAAQLQKYVKPGERVLLLYPPGLEYIAAIFGCWYAGVVAVPAYPPRLNQNLARIEAIIRDAEATIALTTSTILSGLRRKFTDDPLLQQLHWMVPEQEGAGMAEQWHEQLPTRESLALLQYTSGSTGTPKGVMITHNNLMQNAAIIQKAMSLDPSIVCVSWLPAYHDMGLMGLILEPLYLGGSSIIMSPASFLQQPMRWLQTISRFKANTSGGSNFAFDLCVSKATPDVLATLDLSSWDMAFVGSEPVHSETLERFYQTFAPCGLRKEVLYPCYGLAESTLLVSGGSKQEAPIVGHFSATTLEQNQAIAVAEHDEEAHPLVGCGKAQSEQQILIVDPVSQVTCAPNQIGEIWVKGPNIAQGYWRKPKETQETFQAFLKDSNEGPFLRTGDMGFFSEGELFVTGRFKDLIIIRGQNYYPQDIEKTAELSHPALKQNSSAAFSLEVEGEERTILVMEIDRQYRHQEPQEIFSAIRQAIIEEYSLRVYAIVLIRPGSILKTSSGKIQRRACRQALLEQTLAIMFADLPHTVSDLIAQHNKKQDEIVAPEPSLPVQQLIQSENTKSLLEVSDTRDNILANNPAYKRSEQTNMQFSLLYFSSDASETSTNKYQLLLEGAKFADQHDFTAVWIPERHFHPFGGLYPNPSVLAAGLAIATQKIRLRAGSVVLPMHHPIRVAEEWSVVDNLSSGRVDLAFAIGWNPNDFVLAPTQYANRRDVLFAGIETFQKLWRGDTITLPNGLGKEAAIKIYPQPIQPALTPWITCTSTAERFIEAGAMGANVLTGLLFQSPEELAEKITAYRNARAQHGYDPHTGHVTLMLHTFVGEDIDEVRQKVRKPFMEYLKSSVDLWRKGAKKLDDLTAQEQEQVMSYAFERYFQTHALFGTPQSCSKMVDYLYSIGVDEIASLIDFGLDTDTVMDGLYLLNSLRKRFQHKTELHPSRATSPALGTGGTSPALGTGGTWRAPSDHTTHASHAESLGANGRTPGAAPTPLSSPHTTPPLIQQLSNMSQEQQLAHIIEYLQKQMAHVLERSVAEIARVQNIRSLGLDSLLVMSVVNNCQRDLQLTLDAGQFYEHTSFSSLASYIATEFQRAYQMEKSATVSDTHLTVQRQEQQNIFPASFGQQRFWFLYELQSDPTAYNILMALGIKGDLDIDALEWSLQEIIRRHESLRTSLTMQEGQLVQIVNTTTAFTLSQIPLNQLDSEARDREIRRLAQQESQTPFDLTQGPLLRARLLLLDSQEYVLLFIYHHIAMDGWSRGILLRELQTLYTAHIAGQPSPLAELSTQYTDFSLWQQQHLSRANDANLPHTIVEQGKPGVNGARRQTRIEKQLAYWKIQLAGPLPILELPTDHLHPSVQTFQGAHLAIQLPEHVMADLKQLSQREGVTLYMTLLASFQVLLARYSGQTDILVGMPIAGRNRAEFEQLIGFFVNTLVLRTDLSGNPSFSAVLQRVRGVCLGAYANQDAPFEQVVEAVHPERDLTRPPLFQVMFAMEEASWWVEAALPGASLQQLSIESGVSIFDLTWSISSQGLGEIEYNTALFDPSTIERMLTHWQVLLQSIVAAPDLPISALSYLSREEREQLLVTWNQTQAPLSEVHSLHQLIAIQAGQTPDRIALSYHDEQISYAQLDQRASRLALQLRAEGIGAESLVAILVERSIPLIVGILAVFKAGGAYLPLDPATPVQRISQVLTAAQPQVLLTTQQLAAQLPSTHTTRVCWLETIADTMSSPFPTWHEEVSDPQQLSYVIYTSGSTGQPKGVMIHQQGMLNHLYAKIEELQLRSDDCVAQNASSSFDISVWQMWAILLQGGRMHIHSVEEAQQPHLLWLSLREQAITVLELVPSLLHMLLDELEGTTVNTSDLSVHLRVLLATGEVLSPELYHRWARRQQEIPLVNAYGPTECSDDVTHAWLHTKVDLSCERVPIGRALRNTQLYVLDAEMELVPVGRIGELYVGGKGVGRGYLGAPGQTAARFVPNPWSPEAGARLYRTGDLVRYWEHGTLEYIGRVDEQVKLRGYRIELGEIEAVLERHPLVQQSVVQLYQPEQDVHLPSLIAYLTIDEQELSLQLSTNPLQQALIAQLRQYVEQVLPDYMIPTSWMIVPEFPLTHNGKVDRRSLPTPEKQVLQVTEQATLEICTPIEEIILGVYCAILGVEQISIHESFFDLGGHSLLATQVIARIRKLLHIEIPLRSLFETPSIAGLARRVEQMLRHQQTGTMPALVSVSREQDLPLSFAQERLWILHQLEPLNVSYHMPAAFRISGPLSVDIFDRCLQAMIQRHEVLRTTFTVHAEHPIQIINSHLRVDLPLVDLQDMDESKQSLAVSQWIHEAVVRPFDLSQGPLLRTGLLRLHDEEYIFLVTLHHILFDAWSTTIFLRELPLLYQAFSAGQPSPLVPHALHYADFAFWQRSWLKGKTLDAFVDYWTEQLRGAVPLELPTDRPKTATISDRGALYTFKLPAQLTQAVKALSRREGVTLFMTLLTAFQIVLYHYTGQQDIVVGTDIANRTVLETEELIGFFVNLLVLRTRLAVQATFSEMVKSVSSMMLDAYAHQDLPFEKLVDALQLARTPGRIPLVNVLFVLQNVPPQAFELPGLTVNQVDIEINTAKFDVALFLEEDGQELRGSVNYRTDLFDTTTIERLVHHFETLLHNCVAHPDTPIETLEILTEEEKEQGMRENERRVQTQQRSLKAAKRRVITSSTEN